MLGRASTGLLALGAWSVVAACSGTIATGTGGGAGTGAATSASTGASASTASSSGGDCPGCAPPFLCCDGVCSYPQNDVLNCGVCDSPCNGAEPYCHQGVCGQPACSMDVACSIAQFCCGSACCNQGQLCCDVPGPISDGPSCQSPTAEGTCPQGCPECKCASPETPIATPQGERRIADIAAGDLVYSVDREAIVAVPVLRTNRAPVSHHEMIRVRLANGAVLEMSPGHPTADRRTFGDLRAGDALDQIGVVEARRVPYAHPFTYDILPASGTRTYFAGGALVGTTLAR